MKIVEYLVGEESNPFYDFSTIHQILKIDRSKLQRDLRRVSGKEFIKYKNQHLYKKETLFTLMLEQIFERLDKNNEIENELPKDTLHPNET